MRIRSLHPMYLDSKGLVALRRETLLAKHVLEGKTKGYTMHPQLERFKEHPDPLGAIGQYLATIRDEASVRGYTFDHNKVGSKYTKQKIIVTQGQLDYERKRLLQKLRTRDPIRYDQWVLIQPIQPHPLFHIISGGIASWERSL